MASASPAAGRGVIRDHRGEPVAGYADYQFYAEREYWERRYVTDRAREIGVLRVIAEQWCGRGSPEDYCPIASAIAPRKPGHVGNIVRADWTNDCRETRK